MPNLNDNITSVAVVGLGLIGGSLAKSFNSIGLKVYGVDVDKDTLLKANNDKIFELVTDKVEDIFELDIDLLYIALPIKNALNILDKLIPFNGLITDALSSKVSVVDKAKMIGLNFIGGHPIAGKEVSGYANSDAKLMSGARHILIESDNTVQLNRLIELHQKIGMRVDIMSAKEHDDIFAVVSHLPHLIAFNLIDYVNRDNSKAFNFVGAGFKDFTRIAGSDEKMWSDILIDNKANILKSIERLTGVINEWRDIIKDENSELLTEKIKEISRIRRELK